MAKVYVLTETDSTEVTWCHNEVFSTRKKAIEGLRKAFQEELDERGDLVADSFISANGEKANIESMDFVIIAWSIHECEVV